MPHDREWEEVGSYGDWDASATAEVAGTRGRYYYRVVFDAEHFTDGVTGGPFSSRAAAVREGKSIAREWWADNRSEGSAAQRCYCPPHTRRRGP